MRPDSLPPIPPSNDAGNPGTPEHPPIPTRKIKRDSMDIANLEHHGYDSVFHGKPFNKDIIAPLSDDQIYEKFGDKYTDFVRFIVIDPHGINPTYEVVMAMPKQQ